MEEGEVRWEVRRGERNSEAWSREGSQGGVLGSSGCWYRGSMRVEGGAYE